VLLYRVGSAAAQTAYGIHQRIEKWLLTRAIEEDWKPLSALQHEHSNSR